MRFLFLLIGFLTIPFSLFAQVSLLSTIVSPGKDNALPVTVVKGRVTDGVSNKPLSFISISFTGSTHGTSSDDAGNFTLSAAGAFNNVTFSFVGYKTVLKLIKPGQVNEVSIKLYTDQKQLNQVTIVSSKNKKYRNKGNPAVELIQQVIDHKEENRMESTDYLQYKQYERIGFTLFNVPTKLMNIRFFSKFKFMLDTTLNMEGKKQLSVPVYFNEKLFQNYFRKTPKKEIRILEAENGINVIKFIDTTGVDIYLNRLYGSNIDIYENNIFVIVNQFLSPIANNSPNYYKFFITDTIQTDKGNLIELSFTPRNKGDLLFEGKLLVTQDGHYAVTSCELDVNQQININFIRSLKIKLDFKQQANYRYYLTKSDVKADFGLLKKKSISIVGDRTVTYSDYKLNAPKPVEFYNGKELQTAVHFNTTDTAYWTKHRTDTLTAQQLQAYARVNKLQNMQSFKQLTWIAATLTGDYADLGPLQAGPIGSTYSFNSQEGSRFQLAGRTTPKFNSTVYLDGFTGYGTKDSQFKYELNTYFSLNKTAPYRYPNNYIKIHYLYDVDIPGQSFSVNNSQAALNSFQSGTTDYWLYDRIFSVNYTKELENHLSYNLTFRNWKQRPAGTLIFNLNDQSATNIPALTTSEFTFGLRYAPHEQIIQGTQERRTILSKYPILNLQLTHGFKGIFNGGYSYNNITANIYKRFYLSQLGYSDVTLLGSIITGKVPFPLLNISPANQSIGYDADAYNKMYYLEFVSDHYAGINFTQSFNGFFLNKIPLIKHLKWREYLSAKILYGGLRDENNPSVSGDLYRFPSASNGAKGTYGFGKMPYIESGIGIGNIFKAVRVDLIKRFNYLDHPGVSVYSIKLSISPDF